MVHSFVSAGIEVAEHLNPALLFGLMILCGTFGSRLSQKFHMPQVVGCIIVGILLGDVLGWITPETIESLEPFMMFALGVIGFMIGANFEGTFLRNTAGSFLLFFSRRA